MAAPQYSTAGAGVTDAGGVWTISGGVTISDSVVWIFQVLQDGATSGAVALTSVTNAQDLAGNNNAATFIGSFNVGASAEAIQHLWIGRGIAATGIPSFSGTNSTSEDLYARMYAFITVSTGTTLTTVIENSTAGSTANSVGTDNTATDAGVTTLGPDRLALNFVAINDDDAISAFTGESGGDWTLAVSPYAESSGTDGAIGLQIATISAAATINGGSENHVDSDAWGVVGFALIGTTPMPSGYQPRDAETFHDFR